MPDLGDDVAAKGHILFVDDDPFYRDMAAAALDDAGYDVTLAVDGASAIDLVQHETFDLVVVDLSMPGISGYDVIERLHGADGRPSIPTLVITGREDTQSVEQAFHVGASSFLAKPVNWVLFVHHVNFLLKSARAEADLKTATRMAEFMNSLKTRLISTIANDAQQPLKSAFGFATLMVQEADGPVSSPLYATWIAEIHRALEKVVATHTKMLDFGRALSETIELSEQPFNFSRLMMDLANDAAELGARRSIKLDRGRLPKAPLNFRGDPALISQALRVPLENAMRLSPRGSTVSIELSDTSTGDVLISIVDGSARAAGSLQTPARPGDFNSSVNFEHSSSMRLMRAIIEAHGGSFEVKAATSSTTITEVTLPRARRMVGDVPDARLQASGGASILPLRPVASLARSTLRPSGSGDVPRPKSH